MAQEVMKGKKLTEEELKKQGWKSLQPWGINDEIWGKEVERGKSRPRILWNRTTKEVRVTGKFPALPEVKQPIKNKG